MATIHLHHGEQDGVVYEDVPESHTGIVWVPSYKLTQRLEREAALGHPLNLLAVSEMDGLLPYVFARIRHLEDGTEVQIYEFCEDILIRDDNHSA